MLISCLHARSKWGVSVRLDVSQEESQVKEALILGACWVSPQNWVTKSHCLLHQFPKQYHWQFSQSACSGVCKLPFHSRFAWHNSRHLLAFSQTLPWTLCLFRDRSKHRTQVHPVTIADYPCLRSKKLGSFRSRCDVSQGNFSQQTGKFRRFILLCSI